MPGPELTVSHGPTRTITDDLLSAIKARGLSISRLARQAGVSDESIRRFVNGKGDLRSRRPTSSPSNSGSRHSLRARPGRKPSAKLSARPLTDGLLLAIKADGRNAWKLGEAAGVRYDAISQFVNGHGSLKLTTVNKLFNALKLKVVRQAPGSQASAEPETRPLTDALLSAIKADAADGRSVEAGQGGWCQRSGHPPIRPPQ